MKMAGQKIHIEPHVTSDCLNFLLSIVYPSMQRDTTLASYHVAFYNNLSLFGNYTSPTTAHGDIHYCHAATLANLLPFHIQ